VAAVGIEPSSGTWRNYVARLKRSGLIYLSDHGYGLTADLFVFGGPSR